MKRRDQERQASRATLMAEREAVNLAARLKAEARIQAALDANRVILERRRQEFNVREEQNEQRRRWRSFRLSCSLFVAGCDLRLHC